jgi:hypothetical protein
MAYVVILCNGMLGQLLGVHGTDYNVLFKKEDNYWKSYWIDEQYIENIVQSDKDVFST